MPNYILPKANIEAANHAAGTVIGSFVSAINELCDSRQTDTMAILRNSGFYKRDVKKNANLARKDMNRILTHQKLHLRKEYHEFYYTYVDNCIDEMKPHVDTLYTSILQNLTKKQIPNRNIIAHMETDRIMLLLVCQAFDELFNDIKVQTSVDISEVYLPYRPTTALHYWDKALATIINMKPKDAPGIDLNECEDVKLAYKIIQRKFVNASFLDSASEKTIEDMGITIKHKEDDAD